MVTDGILPAWSPDGRHLAFTSFRDGNLDLFVADRDGGNLRNLIRHEGSGTRAERGPRTATVSVSSPTGANRFSTDCTAG